MSDYIVAIPSYKRSENISNKTLKVLNDKGISPKKIYIFVANKQEERDYLKNVDNKLYNKLIVGVKGLRNQRNFMTDYFNEGQNIVELDDDVEEMYQMVEGNDKKPSSRKLKIINNLDMLFKDAFKLCKKYGAHLWGVYPVENPFFMSKKITTDLRFIVGPVWGKINRHDKKFKLKLNEKEDGERTLHNYHADKSVIRFNDITMKTSYYQTQGGMQSENKDRKKEGLKSAKYLNKKYPKYTKIWLGKKSGHPEIRMNDITDKRPRVDRYIKNKGKYYIKSRNKTIKKRKGVKKRTMKKRH